MRKKSRKNEEIATENVDGVAAETVAAAAEVTAEPVTEAHDTAAEPVTEAVDAIGAEGTVTVPEPKPRKDKVLTPKQRRIRAVVRFIIMNVGIIMMSFSVYFFQTPNNLTLGGVAGIAIMLSNVIPVEWLSQAVVMAIINVILLILGLIILGKQCTIKTIYCSLLYTAIIWLFEHFDVLGHITGVATPVGGIAKPMSEQPFLELVYAILLFGVGGALVFNCGSSSGGTDIIALILKKFTKINVGMSLMIIDLLVVCVSIITFQSIETALFSFMGLFAKSFLLDGVIESIGKTKYITIITTKPNAIAKYILEVIQHGYTKYDAEGGYTGEEKKVLVTVCKRSEALRLKTKVKELDPEAFVIITDANEILGKGFGGTVN